MAATRASTTRSRPRPSTSSRPCRASTPRDSESRSARPSAATPSARRSVGAQLPQQPDGKGHAELGDGLVAEGLVVDDADEGRGDPEAQELPDRAPEAVTARSHAAASSARFGVGACTSSVCPGPRRTPRSALAISSRAATKVASKAGAAPASIGRGPARGIRVGAAEHAEDAGRSCTRATPRGERTVLEHLVPEEGRSRGRELHGAFGAVARHGTEVLVEVDVRLLARAEVAVEDGQHGDPRRRAAAPPSRVDVVAVETTARSRRRRRPASAAPGRPVPPRPRAPRARTCSSTQ